MSDFAVLRIAKIHTLKGLSGAAAHNARTASAGCGHADNRTPLMGGGVRLVAGQEDALAAWTSRTKAVGLSKPRKDAVRALEVVMSATPRWFQSASPEDRQEWLDQSLAWATDLFGADNVLSAHLHDDEGNPHLHLLAVPLKQKSRKKAGRPRRGRERKASLTWGLSAADFVGSPELLVELQTQYATQVSGLGIRRGRARRVTGAQHVSASAYRAQAADELSSAKEIRTEALNELTIAKDVGATAQRSAKETAKAFTTGLDAVDRGELTYAPSTNDARASLVRHKVEEPALPAKADQMKKWKLAIRPLFKALLAYAKRAAMLKERNDIADAREAEISKREQQIQADAATVARMLKRTGQPTVEAEVIRERNRKRVR